MKRLFPHRLLALSLLVMWVLLNQSLSPGQLLLGSAVAIGASFAMAALKPEKVSIRSLRPLPRLAAAVFADIFRSNIAVARIIFRPRSSDRVSGFVSIPLDMRSRYGLSVLSCIITATPGTLWVQYDRQANKVLVHILDLIDEEEWIHLIKHRYERPLMDIFE